MEQVKLQTEALESYSGALSRKNNSHRNYKQLASNGGQQQSSDRMYILVIRVLEMTRKSRVSVVSQYALAGTQGAGMQLGIGRLSNGCLSSSLF